MANIKIEKKNSFRIEYTKGDTYALKMTFKNVDQDLTTAIFTVKENFEDATPLIEKTIGAGISKLDENFYKRELVYKLQLQATDSQFLEADHLYLYDLKIAVGNVIKTVIKGNFVVTYNVTGVDRITTELAEIEIDDAIETDAETTPATHGIEYETDPVATAKIGDMSTLSTTAKSTLVEAINEIAPKANTALEEINKIEDGTVTVPSATHATSADSATNAQIAQYASIDTGKGSIDSRLNNIEQYMKVKTYTCNTLNDLYAKLQTLDVSQIVNIIFDNKTAINGYEDYVEINGSGNTYHQDVSTVIMTVYKYVLTPTMPNQFISANNYSFLKMQFLNNGTTTRVNIQRQVIASGSSGMSIEDASVSGVTSENINAEFKLTYMEI